MRSRGPESFWGQMMPHSSATKQLRRQRDELEQWLARGVSEATAKWAVVPAAQGLLQWRGVGWGGSLLVGSRSGEMRARLLELRGLRQEGLISEAVWNEKCAELLQDM